MECCFVALFNIEGCARKVHNLFNVGWKAFYILKMHCIQKQFFASAHQGGARSWLAQFGIHQFCCTDNCSFFHSFGHKTCTPGTVH